MFAVSRITVRKALQDLVTEGWLVRRQGRGTFVDLSRARRPASIDIREAMQQVADLGAATQVRDGKVAETIADDETLAALDLAPGERVQQARHVRVLAGVPLGLITTYVPMRIASKVAGQRGTTRQPMFQLIARSGIKVTEAEQWIGATLADVETARALDVDVGAPLLKITRIVCGARRIPVERVVALYRADAYHYRMHLKPMKKQRGA